VVVEGAVFPAGCVLFEAPSPRQKQRGSGEDPVFPGSPWCHRPAVFSGSFPLFPAGVFLPFHGPLLWHRASPPLDTYCPSAGREHEALGGSGSTAAPRTPYMPSVKPQRWHRGLASRVKIVVEQDGQFQKRGGAQENGERVQTITSSGPSLTARPVAWQG